MQRDPKFLRNQVKRCFFFLCLGFFISIKRMTPWGAPGGGGGGSCT